MSNHELRLEFDLPTAEFDTIHPRPANSLIKSLDLKDLKLSISWLQKKPIFVFGIFQVYSGPGFLKYWEKFLISHYEIFFFSFIFEKSLFLSR